MSVRVYGALRHAWHPIQGVFPLHAQCSWDSLWIRRNAKQDKAITEDESFDN